MKLRKWQSDALKVIKQTVKSNDKTIIPVNACVGSGKTFVAESAFGEFIKLHYNEKTVQLFVTPRVRLCKQQAEEIEKTLAARFNLKNKHDYRIVQVDYTQKEYNWRSSKLYAKHVIFVICDESLFGLDPAINNAKVSRFVGWLRNFKEWQKNSYKLGFAVFDEAHNYENCNYYIIGTKVSVEDSVNNFFKVMLLSGTPSAFQKDLTNLYHRNVCSCKPKVAIENGWIVKPKLNIVKGCTETSWARAVVAVLNREIKICSNEVFKPRIMINCSGIDEIKKLRELDYFKKNAGKKFHFISLHSIKKYNENNKPDEIKPMVDNEEVDAYGKDEDNDKHTAYGRIRRIDSDTAFDDDLPIIVAQVQMLGEGINVKSFNACLTSTNSEKTIVQQIGRIIRNYMYKGKEKVKDGHANIYCMYDNETTLTNLLKKFGEYDLTSDCFQWGVKLDVSTSSGTSDDNDEILSLNTDFHWEKIDPSHDIEIVAAQNAAYDDTSKRKEIIYRILSDRDLDGNGIPDKFEFDEAIKILCEKGYVKQYSKMKIDVNNITEEIRRDVLNGMLLNLQNMLKIDPVDFVQAFIKHTVLALTVVFNHDKNVAEIMAKLLTDEEKDWLAVEKGWLKNENI